MAKIKSVYICSECGYESPKWYGKCPGCNQWNTMNEEIKENGVDPKKVLFIGDTDHDYEVATSIGVDCLLIANGHQSKERLLKVTSNVVDDIIDTLEVIF